MMIIWWLMMLMVIAWWLMMLMVAHDDLMTMNADYAENGSITTACCRCNQALHWHMCALWSAYFVLAKAAFGCENMRVNMCKRCPLEFHYLSQVPKCSHWTVPILGQEFPAICFLVSPSDVCEKSLSTVGLHHSGALFQHQVIVMGCNTSGKHAWYYKQP